MTLRIVEIYAYAEWAAAVYQAEDGEEYNLTLHRSYDKNPGYEHTEVLNIEKTGIEMPEDDLIWKEVKLALKKPLPELALTTEAK